MSSADEQPMHEETAPVAPITIDKDVLDDQPKKWFFIRGGKLYYQRESAAPRKPSYTVKVGSADGTFTTR